MIIPHVFVSDESSRALRRHFLTNNTLRAIDAFPEEDNLDTRVFRDAKQAVCITMLRCGSARFLQPPNHETPY